MSYQYLRNKEDFKDQMLQDYYKEQGFLFIMLIVGQIQQTMLSVVKALNNNTLSFDDILLMARFMIMEQRGDIWNLKNVREKELKILQQMGFEPSYSAPA